MYFTSSTVLNIMQMKESNTKPNNGKAKARKWNGNGNGNGNGIALKIASQHPAS